MDELAVKSRPLEGPKTRPWVLEVLTLRFLSSVLGFSNYEFMAPGFMVLLLKRLRL